MTWIQRSVARTKRRLVLAGLVRWLGWAALVALSAVCVMRIVDQWLPLVALPLWAYAVPGGLAVVGALVFSLRSMPSDADIAVLLDDRLNLQDKLGTALYTATLPEQTELSRQVAREADEAAQRSGAVLHQAVPIRLTRAWNGVPVVMGLVVAAVFLPESDPLGQVARQAAQEEERRVAEQVEEIMINTTQSLPTGEDTPDTELIAGAPDALRDELLSLAEEIHANPERAEELRREGAALVSEAERELSEQADIVEAAYRPLENANSQLDAGQEGPANDFQSAMNRNDFEGAEQAVRELQQQIANDQSLTPDQRRQAQQQLNNIAQQLQQQAQSQQQQQQTQQQQAQQNLQQQLQQQGMSPQQAAQTAQQMTQQMQQSLKPQNQGGS